MSLVTPLSWVHLPLSVLCVSGDPPSSKYGANLCSVLQSLHSASPTKLPELMGTNSSEIAQSHGYIVTSTASPPIPDARGQKSMRHSYRYV